MTKAKGWKTKDGHIRIKINGIAKFVHVRIAENAVGKSLPVGAVVHHVDCDGSNNNNTNLVICQSRGYHKILHTRTDALNACGNANWKKCTICKQYSDPDGMRINNNRRSSFSNLLCSRELLHKRYINGNGIGRTRRNRPTKFKAKCDGSDHRSA